jgi:transposase
MSSDAVFWAGVARDRDCIDGAIGRQLTPKNGVARRQSTQRGQAQGTHIASYRIASWAGDRLPRRNFRFGSRLCENADVFVDELDLRALGFEGVVPETTGRPAYHPATMLKIYVYGYINQVQSSRRLERETARNVEMMWLTGRLTPDFKTIADFRKDNGPAIRSACRQFVTLCRNMKLFTHAIVAIDGSRFKAVNSRDRSFSRGSIQRRMEQVESSIERYLSALETADRQEGELAQVKSARLKDKIASLREQMRKYKALEVAVHAAPDKQISLTDPTRGPWRRAARTPAWSATMCRPWSMPSITWSSRMRSPISATIAASSRRWPSRRKRRRACAI